MKAMFKNRTNDEPERAGNDERAKLELDPVVRPDALTDALTDALEAVESMDSTAPSVDTKKKDKPRKDVQYKGTGFAWSWLGWLIIVIAIMPVIVQNTQIVQVRYLIWDIRVPLAAAFLAVAVIADVATEIIGWAWRARRRRELAIKAELKELKRKTASDA